MSEPRPGLACSCNQGCRRSATPALPRGASDASHGTRRLPAIAAAAPSNTQHRPRTTHTHTTQARAVADRAPAGCSERGAAGRPMLSTPAAAADGWDGPAPRQGAAAAGAQRTQHPKRGGVGGATGCWRLPCRGLPALARSPLRALGQPVARRTRRRRRAVHPAPKPPPPRRAPPTHSPPLTATKVVGWFAGLELAKSSLASALAAMAKKISQETFDAVVKENQEDFDMPLEEAVQVRPGPGRGRATPSKQWCCQPAPSFAALVGWLHIHHGRGRLGRPHRAARMVPHGRRQPLFLTAINLAACQHPHRRQWRSLNHRALI